MQKKTARWLLWEHLLLGPASSANRFAMNPLSLSTRPGANSRANVGKHIGKLPILFAILFAFLLLGGIIFGAANRMNRSDVVSQPAADPEVPEEFTPVESFVITDSIDEDIVEEDDKPDDSSIPRDNGIRPNTNTPDAIIEFRNRQKLEELQARSAGQQSVSKISFNLVNDPGQSTTASSDINTIPPAITNDPLARQSALLNALSRRDAVGATDQNNQSEKISFAEKERLLEGYLLNSVTATLSPYEIKTGAVIPGLLLTDLNSDLPGMVLGQVRTNVYDSATGQHVLIPQGSRLIGEYDSRISYGQSRALVVWRRVVFPNGVSLDLLNMSGVDQAGASGFKDRVNKHYGRIFGGIFGLSVFQSISALIKSDRKTASSSSELEKITAANLSKTGEKLIEKNLAIQPTIRIRAGYRFNILVHKDILFPGAYGG